MRLGRLEEARVDCVQGATFIDDREADGLRALHARILARSGEHVASVQKLSEIESTQLQNYLDVVDRAAAYAQLLKRSTDEKYRQPLLEALDQARSMDREQFAKIQLEPEFADLAEFPGLIAAFQTN